MLTMSEKLLQARIVLKYDTLANWNKSTVILKAGEMAIATIDNPAGGVFDASKTPVVGIKIGDGTHKFSELNWIQAIAGDVYAWAKAATKPTYDASEIQNLADYISGEIQDTNTTYKIEQDATNKHKLTLYSKEVNGNWTAASTITIPDDDTWYTFAEGDQDGTIMVTKFTADDDETERIAVHGLKSAAYTDSSAYAKAEYESKVDTLIGSDTNKSVRTIANEELAAQLIPAGAKESLDTLQEIAAWIQAHPDDASQMSTNIAALKNALDSFVTDTSGTYSSTKDAVKSYVDTAVANADVSGKITTEINKLDSSVSATAADGNQYSVLTGVTETNGKLSAKTEVKLAAIAKTGNVNDLIQTAGDVLVLDCGSSTVNI
jgi:hypothetical protein